MFTVCARVVIRLKRSLQEVSNEVCYQFMVSLILPVFATVFTGFFHCPGKNSFCHGKNPTLSLPIPKISQKFAHNFFDSQLHYIRSMTY